MKKKKGKKQNSGNNNNNNINNNNNNETLELWIVAWSGLKERFAIISVCEQKKTNKNLQFFGQRFDHKFLGFCE